MTYILDSIAGASCAYSLRRLNTSYSGPLIRVRRASDSTEQDINASGDYIDEAALATFLSGSNGFIRTWYDQSGNANHAIQTTTANQPQILLGRVNGRAMLVFDGTNDHLSLTSTVAITGGFSAFHIYDRRPGTNASENPIGFGITSGIVPFSNYAMIVAGAAGFGNDGGASYPTVTPYTLSTFEVGSTRYCWRNGTSVSLSSSTFATATPFATIGRRATDYAVMQAGEFILFAGADKRSDRTTIESSQTTYWLTAPPTKWVNIDFIGDSITRGYSSTVPIEKLSDLFLSYPLASLKRNYGVDSAYFSSTIGSNVIAQRTPDVTYAYQVAVVWGGTNDMYFGRTGTQAYNDLVAYCNAARAAYPDRKIMVLNALSRTSSGGAADFATQRATFNGLIAANWATFADAFVDVAAIPELSDHTNTTYFSGDQTHPNQKGTQPAADAVFAAVPALLSAEITVTEPQASDIVLVGGSVTIDADELGTSGDVDILLSIDNGSTFPITIASSETLPYTWTPTSAQVAAQAVVRIRDSADNDVTDDSGVFAIATTSPGGGTNTALWFRLQELAIADGLELSRP